MKPYRITLRIEVPDGTHPEEIKDRFVEDLDEGPFQLRELDVEARPDQREDRPELPADIEEIATAHAVIDRPVNHDLPTPYILTFKWGGVGVDLRGMSYGEIENVYQGVTLATFESPIPLHIPAAGDVVRVHGVPVKVAHREVSYAVADETFTEVWASVYVEPLDTNA